MRHLLADSLLCSAFDSAMLFFASSKTVHPHRTRTVLCYLYTVYVGKSPDLFPCFREKFPGENLRARLCRVKVLQEGLSGEGGGVYILGVESSRR